jgi:hypothetical protein
VSDSKPEETFRVIDRRPFREDGSLREDVAADELAREQKEHASASTIAPPKPASPPAIPSAPPAPSGQILNASGAAAAPAPAAEPAPAGTPAPSRAFQSLISFLAQNAAAVLGAYPDPRTGQAMLDLEAAQEMIGMLDTLREKTRGNIAPDEDRILLEVISSLKMSYMEMTKAAADAMKKQSPINPTKK